MNRTGMQELCHGGAMHFVEDVVEVVLKACDWPAHKQGLEKDGSAPTADETTRPAKR